MNVAILLGVSEYKNANNLPACKKDLEKMSELIKATGKYDANILCISENTDAANVKEIITNKISDLKDKEINEIFFYFTGHGDFYKNEFYYVLSDFDKERRKQTALENLEVDNWFRSLNPKITIKVVDACHAGVIYVKEDDNKLEKYLNQSQGRFKNCYFMFSSNSDQSSYQDNILSFFTKSFINAVKFHNANDIRYKDIIDYISDDFENITTDQTPFFVTQADYTEKFCSINSNIKNLFLSPNEDLKSDKIKLQTENKTLEFIIKADAKSYLDKEELEFLLDDMSDKAKNHKYSDEFISLYDIEYDFFEILDVPKEEIIGNWLNENENEYFAEIETKREYYDVKVPEMNDISIPTGKYITKRESEKVISGFDTTIDISFDCIEIIARPKYPNIPCYRCIICFILSKTEIRFFYCFIQYKDISWDEKEMIEEEIKWLTVAAKFENKEDIFIKVSEIQDKYAEFIIESLKEKFEIKGAKEEDN